MTLSLDRREWLRTAALATAATALPCVSSSAGQFTGKIKKAVKYHMIAGEQSASEKLQLLKDLGYDGVEPRMVDQFDKDELLKASEATGIVVHGVTNSSNPDIATAIDMAKYLGGTSVLVTVPADPKGSYLANYKTRQEIIRRAISHAEKHNIRILIENVWASFLIEPLSLARFVDELDSPFVGVYFDVGNNVRWGYPEHWIEVLGKRIGKLDIKEFSRDLQETQGLRAGFKVEIGEGSIDWQRVREELAKIDYSGWATAEVPGGDREQLANIATRMNRVLDL